MKYVHQLHRHLKAVLLVAAATAALYPASSFAGSDAYMFKVVGHPMTSTVAVDLVDCATGQKLTNAGLFRLAWTMGGAKNRPSYWRPISLTANGDGTFTADAEPGDTLHLAARIPGNDERIRGSVEASP